MCFRNKMNHSMKVENQAEKKELMVGSFLQLEKKKASL